MTAASSLISELRSSLTEDSARIARDFAATGDGRAAVAQRTRLIEDFSSGFGASLFLPDEAGPARTLRSSPPEVSDAAGCFLIPTLICFFLFADRGSEESAQRPVQRFSQELWDLRLKLSPASRTLAECDRFDPNNTEFTISLLDCRYLAGDRDLFRAPSRQSDSEARDAGIESHCCKDWPKSRGSGTESSGRPYSISSRI